MQALRQNFTSSTNYMKRMMQEAEMRKWPRRECKLCVGLLIARKGMRNISEGQIWLHNISEGGACASSRIQNLPKHFYIYLGDYQYFIGCAVVGFENDNYHLQFIREQPTEFVDILSRLTDPFEFKGHLRLSLYGLPDQETTFGPYGKCKEDGRDRKSAGAA